MEDIPLISFIHTEKIWLELSLLAVERSVACTAEQVLVSTRQNLDPLYQQLKFWRVIASTPSAEHASGVMMFQLKSYMCIILTLCSDSIGYNCACTF